MPTIIETDRTTTRSLNADDILFIGQDVSIVSTENEGINAGSVSDTDVHITVMGTVLALDQTDADSNDGLGIDMGGAQSSLFIGETGLVQAFKDAILLSGALSVGTNYGTVISLTGYGVTTDGDIVFTNHGTISAAQGYAFRINNDDLIINHGQASGESAVNWSTADNAEFINYGSVTTAESLYGMFIFATDDYLIANHGTYFGSRIFTQTSTGKILNTGTMEFWDGDIGLSLAFGVNETQVENHGTIRTDSIAIAMGAGIDSIINTGLIVGEVIMGGGTNYLLNLGDIVGDVSATSGTDEFINHGAIVGDVSLGSEADIYRGRGEVYGAVSGGTGDDVMLGGAFDDVFLGEDDEDTLRGRDGDDYLDGGNQNDVIYGQRGDDTIIGGNGSDDLRGGAGDDDISGSKGVDTINGGRGNDTMEGGSGVDTFVITRSADHDIIKNFVDGEDLIDISAFGIRSSDFGTTILAAASNAGGGDTLIDLSQVGGNGTLLIEGLAFTDLNSADFIF